MRVKVRTFSGAVCEQEVFTLPDNIGDIIAATAAPPRERFSTEEERTNHRNQMSRRHHVRIVNENYNPSSLYSTLTLDNDNEVHTFAEARKIKELYIRRLQYINPKAVINIYMGRGKSTDRIHFHMLSNGISKEDIASKWTAGMITRCVNLRKRCCRDGIDYGQDYTGLANYLFDHWTEEQGARTHKWSATKTVRQPKREPPTEVKRNYTETKPPLAPKGYRYIRCNATRYGYLSFLYVRI